MLHSICQQIWKTQQWPRDWKRSVFIPAPKKGNAKDCSKYHTIALISHTGKVMLKIFQARLQQFVNRELQDVQAGFRKGRATRDQISNIRWIIEKAREFQKNIYFCFIDYAKALTMWITTNCWKFWKRWEYQTTWPASWEICMQVSKQQLELDMEQQTGSKSGKEYIKAVYCHPAYLTYMWSTSREMLGWMKHKLESILLGEISITSDMQRTTLMAESKEELKSLLIKVKEESGKVGLKFNIHKKIMASGPIISWQIDGETMETLTDFIFLGSKITADGDCSHEIKRCLYLGRKVITNLDSIFKSRDITLPTKVHLVKAMVFPVIMCQKAFNQRLPVCCFGSVRN